MSIKELERRLAKAESRANAWGLSERRREILQAEVDELRDQLADELAARR